MSVIYEGDVGSAWEWCQIKDWNKAREWYMRAVEHGYEDASKKLQELDEKEEEKRKRNETTNKNKSIDEEEREEEEEEKKKQKATKKSESLPERVLSTIHTVPMVVAWKDDAPANAQTMS